MRTITNPRKVLVHWIYTPEEWNSFRKWEWKCLGWLRFLFGLFPSPSNSFPEITISPEQVSLNGKEMVFKDKTCHLRRVHVRESGNINILEIFYQPDRRAVKVIRVPVPRGRLRQAFEVQESLSGTAK